MHDSPRAHGTYERPLQSLNEMRVTKTASIMTTSRGFTHHLPCRASGLAFYSWARN